MSCRLRCRRFYMLRTLAAVFVIAVCCSTVRADLDPEQNKPYNLQVILHFAEHRWLTPVFQIQVQRQLKDSLQVSLGNLARVQIVTNSPLIKDVEKQGGLQNALDRWHQLGDAKQHFLTIGFANGRYEIEGRQFDGFTGLPSP